MADGPVQDAVAGAMRALGMIDRGLTDEQIPTSAMQDLRYVERRLGLTRSLESYAPRTRRRYIAAARKGTSAKTARERENKARKSAAKNKFGLTPTQLAKLNKYRIPILESGVDIGPYLEPDYIRDIVQMYGFKYMITVLADQYDSIKEYTRFNAEPGRTRWNSRGEYEAEAEALMAQKFTAVAYNAKGTDPYYYYHGTIR